MTRLCKGTGRYDGGPSNLTVVLSRGCDFLAPVTCKIGNIVSWKPDNKHHGHWLTRITGGCGEMGDPQTTNSGGCHGRENRPVCL